MNFIKKYQYIKYLFIFFPLLVVTGPFLPDLFISLFSFFFIVILLLNNNTKIFKNNYFLFFIVFYFYLNINSIFSYNPYHSLKVSIPYLRYILFAFILSYLLSFIFNLRKMILYSFFFTYILLLVDSIIQISFGYNILGFKLSSPRVSSFFGEWLVMGSFVARTLPVVLAISFFEEIKYKKIFQFFLLFITGALVIMSSERLAFAYYSIIIFSFIFFIATKKNILIVIFLFFSLFLSLFYLKPNSYDRIFKHSITQFKSADSVFFFSYRHELHYITAYNQFKDSKFIGHGLKSFRLLCDHPKYVPISKIINDNTIYAAFDGYFYLNDGYFIIKKNNSAAAFSFEDPDIIYKLPANGELKNFYVQNGEFVTKNQKIGYLYEYSNGCNTHPHNVHLQFLSELGLFGYFFLFFAIIYIIIKLFLLLKNRIKFKFLSLTDHSIFFCYLGILISLFPIFPSGNFFNNWLSIIFYFNVANLLSYLKIKNK